MARVQFIVLISSFSVKLGPTPLQSDDVAGFYTVLRSGACPSGLCLNLLLIRPVGLGPIACYSGIYWSTNVSEVVSIRAV